MCVYAEVMPTKDAIVAGRMPDRIIEFLASRHGHEFRCNEIAVALDLPSQPVANECGRLARRGKLARRDSEDPTIPTFYTSV